MSTFFIDIDGTFAKTEGNDYSHSKPIKEVIDQINKLFDEGHTIRIFTGRGYTSGKQWRELTAQQLHDWGVKYHVLLMGKPSGGFYVDDRNLSIEQFMKL
jgi:hypothetical protein